MLGFDQDVISKSLLEVTTSAIILAAIVLITTNNASYTYTTMSMIYISYIVLIIFCRLFGTDEER